MNEERNWEWLGLMMVMVAAVCGCGSIGGTETVHNWPMSFSNTQTHSVASNAAWRTPEQTVGENTVTSDAPQTVAKTNQVGRGQAQEGQAAPAVEQSTAGGAQSGTVSTPGDSGGPNVTVTP